MVFLRKAYRKSSVLTAWPRFSALFSPFKKTREAKKKIIIINYNIIIIIICKDHDIEITDKWYKHKPETVMHKKDNNINIMWNMLVNTDRTITANSRDHTSSLKIQ